MKWLTLQAKGLKITKVDLARRIGVSRPTLDKYEHNPGLLALHQLKVLGELGFDVPGGGVLKPATYESVVCPSCGGHGIVYRMSR